MFAKDFSFTDLERIGPVVEQLLESGKLTADEKWAVDISCRAAMDLASIRHTEVAQKFYARPDIQQRTEETINSWLAQNPNADPGTVTMICARTYVASIGRDGELQLTPVLDL